MIKKITALLLILSLSACISACSVNDNPKEDKQTKATTEQVTLIRNTFKDVLPKYNFKNEIKETYVDGINYKFTVKCTQKDSEKYIDKIKKAGFEKVFIEWYNKDWEISQQKQFEYCRQLGLDMIFAHLGYQGINNLWLDNEQGEQLVSRFKNDIRICKENGFDFGRQIN